MLKTKNIVIPVVTALLGLFIGYLIFREKGNGTEKEEHVHTKDEKEQIWTCSMHPQIRQDHPGKCPICGMTLIPLDNSRVDPLVLTMSDEAVRLAQIQTTIIGREDQLTSSVKASGKVEADETTLASLVTHIPGRIEKLYIRFTGEQVYKGQKIATIYSPQLITAQKELLEAYKMKTDQPKLYQASIN